ncbi:MAG: PF20097 family protein [Ruminococcus bromii]|nr:PF20097 family protein [Ruminococcus bromii]
MMCPKCGKEMRNGYLFCSKDGALSFANEVPSPFENAKNAEGFVKLTEPKVGGRTSVEDCCCDMCKTIIIQY